MKDIQRAKEPSMQEQGIWYTTKGSDMYKGFAMIKGPINTPYEGCLLVFSVEFPSDYPFSPPKVVFLTSDGQTRFHPNLYIDGKVCLSILGTYPGPCWSGTQSLSSVLLSILGLLDEDPLSHEPYFNKGNLLDPHHREYADAIEHNFIKLMLFSIQTFSIENESHIWFPFYDIVVEILPSLTKILQEKILKKSENPERLWANLCYSMQFRSYWKRMAGEIRQLAA